MKIEKITLTRIAIPFDSGREKYADAHQDYNAASPALSKMESLLVCIETDDGLTGWGEAFGHLINPVTFCALEQSVGPFFLGKTLSTRADLDALMTSADYAFHGFGRTGPVRYALSAIDIALWDLLSRKAEQPLWRYLGAKRPVIRVYPSLVSYGNEPARVAEKAREVWQQGYDAIKLHETALPAIAAVRRALPADVSLMVDVNCPWSVEEACQQADALRELNLTWLEEPVWPPDDYAGLATVRRHGVPLSAGENAAGDADFARLVSTGAVDILQPSVCKVGGISGMLRVFALGREHAVTVIPHCFYYGAGLLATAHLISLLPENVRLEVPWVQWTPLLHPFLNIQPEMTLPDSPGLGFEPNPEVLADFTIASATCIFNGGSHA